MNSQDYQKQLAQQNALLQSQQVDPTQQLVPSSGSAVLQQILGQQDQQPTDIVSTVVNALRTSKANSTGNQGGFGPPPAGMSQSEWNNQCQRWIESVTGNHQTGKFPTAANALQYYAKNGQLNTDLSKAPPNALIYYAASPVNGGDGHVAINLGGGMTRGATSNNGIQDIPLNGWGAKPVGFVIPQ